MKNKIFIITDYTIIGDSMANRKVHDYIAKILTGKDLDEIDKINRDIDEPYKWLGRYHRVLYHNKNPLSGDSLLINRGKFDREVIRQIHIWLDENPEIGDTLEAYLLMKKKRRR